MKTHPANYSKQTTNSLAASRVDIQSAQGCPPPCRKDSEHWLKTGCGYGLGRGGMGRYWAAVIQTSHCKFPVLVTRTDLYYLFKCFNGKGKGLSGGVRFVMRVVGFSLFFTFLGWLFLFKKDIRWIPTTNFESSLHQNKFCSIFARIWPKNQINLVN